MNSTNIFILRHGEVQGGAIFRGSQDDPLTENGLRQLQKRLEHSDHTFDIVISSPLIRCADFAKEYARINRLPIEIVADIKEMDFGDWEGKSFEAINQTAAEKLEKFFSNPIENPAPNGEDLRAFRTRVVSALEKVLIDHSGKNILIVTHGGVQKVIFTHALKMPLDAVHSIDTPYASISQFTIYNEHDNFTWLLRRHG